MKFVGSIALLLLLPLSAAAEDWPHWRGPQFNGSTTETNLPTQFSRTEGVRWSAELAGAAASTPIVWEDRVFLSGINTEKDTLDALCFDRLTGKPLWKKEIAEGVRRDDRSSYAAPSPTTDGQRVFFFFSSGQLVCFDFEGRRQWSRNIQDEYGTFAFQWTFASSPTLFDGRLYLQVLQRDVPVAGRGFDDRENDSYLLALEPETGKTLWHHVRPTDAVAESREAFSTPIPYRDGDRAELLVSGGDAISAHDPKTGKELWRWGNWNANKISHWRLVPSPVAGAGVVLVCAPKRNPIYAVRDGLSGKLGDDALAWTTTEVGAVTADVSTPAFYDGDFFILSDVRKTISRVAGSTGAVKWTVDTPGRSKYEASPLLADGKVYLVNFDGQVDILDAKSGELINSIAMDEPDSREVVRSSIIAAHGQLFIRTTRHLYCIEKQ